jgi:hypothetical protein
VRRLVLEPGASLLETAYPKNLAAASTYRDRLVVWEDLLQREIRRFEDAEARLPAPGTSARARQALRRANAAYGAALALLLGGAPRDAREWLRRAADGYREGAAASWGQTVATLKAALLARSDVTADAEQALGRDASSAVASYAKVLALLALDRDAEALPLAEELAGQDDFPRDVAAALAALARSDADSYADAVADVLASFEERGAYLEGVPVADTVLVLQLLADARGCAARLSSPRLPPLLG